MSLPTKDKRLQTAEVIAEFIVRQYIHFFAIMPTYNIALSTIQYLPL